MRLRRFTGGEPTGLVPLISLDYLPPIEDDNDNKNDELQIDVHNNNNNSYRFRFPHQLTK
jgi:hypothetical protein